MKDLVRALDEHVESLKKLKRYGYIGYVGEGVHARQMDSDSLTAMIEAYDLPSVVTTRGCETYPYKLKVGINEHTLFCVLTQEQYDEYLKVRGQVE